jgi:flagella basal body P-ring formation protein FlgA
MTVIASFAIAGCLAVASGADQILFRDLAAAFPSVVNVPAETPLAPAPSPGMQRVFQLPELRRLAARLHLGSEPQSEVCVERPVQVPDPARLLAAMQRALGTGRVEIIEYNRQSLPEGELEFPLAGLRPSGSGSALWSGWVRYAGNRRYHTWARVKVAVTLPRVIAAADLRTGEAIDVAKLRLEMQDVFPSAMEFAGSFKDVIGKWPRIPIRSGTAIRVGQLQSPTDVMRGQMVTVVVREGATHLETEARTEGSGAVGETIQVVNLTSHRRFTARVEGKGRVSVGNLARKENP